MTLAELVEKERFAAGAPGLSVVVVQGGETLLAEGFGELTAGGPACTATSLFPIASDTKGFVAALLCLLAREQRIGLDTPVRDVVPGFVMHDPIATATVTLRDLLSHRSGLPRHDLVWYGDAGLSLAELTARLRHLELDAPPGTRWAYCNLGYQVAGHVVEVLTGRTWTDVLRERLLVPLGMTATRFEIGDGVALPHARVDGQLVTLQPPPDALPSPAGALVSSAVELGSWLLARLGRRPDALPLDLLADLHDPVSAEGISQPGLPEREVLGYALGCHVDRFRGRTMVRHGGTIAGYCSDVVVLPELDLGIAVAANLHATPLRESLPLSLVDRVLGLPDEPWFERCATQPARTTTATAQVPVGDDVATAACEGTFRHPAYGRLSIRLEGDGLVPDFHALGDRLALRRSADRGWELVLTEYGLAFPAGFVADSAGTVVAVSAGLEPAVSPIRFDRVA